MNWLKWTLIAGVVGALAVVVSLADRASRRRVRRRLADRPQLTAHAFGETHFGPSAARSSLAEEVRQILAQYVPVSLDGLSPDDAFAKDLEMDEMDSMASVEFVIELERRFDVKIPDADAERILTFRELVLYLERRLGERPDTKDATTNKATTNSGSSA